MSVGYDNHTPSRRTVRDFRKLVRAADSGTRAMIVAAPRQPSLVVERPRASVTRSGVACPGSAAGCDERVNSRAPRGVRRGGGPGGGPAGLLVRRIGGRGPPPPRGGRAVPPP